MKLELSSKDSLSVRTPHSLPSRRRRPAPGWCCALVVLLATLAVRAATVTWTGGSGDWSTPADWSTGALPGTNDDVVIGPGPATIVTHSSGADAVRSIRSEQAFVLSGGSLAVSSLFQADGGITVSGGTIYGGTVVVSNGASLVVASGTLDRVTVDGLLDVGRTANGASLTVTNGLVLNGTAYVGSPTLSAYGAIGFAGTQTLGGNGTVLFGTSNPWGNEMANALWLVYGGTTLTIGPGITVRGQNGTVGAVPSSPWSGPASAKVVNQGIISADVSGGTIVINAQPFTNDGLVQSPAGALSVNWWENAGQTWAVSGNAVSLNLAGGNIHGGNLILSNGVPLVVSGNLTLDGVSVNGVLDVGRTVNGASVTVTNGLVLNGTAYLGNPTNSNYGAIGFAGTQTLGGNGTVLFGASNPWGNDMANALWLVYGGTTLTNGPGITVRGQNGTVGAVPSSPWSGPANVTVVNQGTISADVAGGTIVLSAQPLTNLGLVQSPAGTVDLAGMVSGLGNIQSVGGAVEVTGLVEHYRPGCGAGGLEQCT